MQPVSWTAPEFEEKERHQDWIWTVGLVFGLGAIVAFFYNNIFFGILLIIGGAMTIMFALRKPSLVTTTIDEKNLIIGNHSIPYKSIKQFWIDENQKPDKLLVLVGGGFVPMLVLTLDGVAAQTVRDALKARLVTEVEMKESFSARVFDRFGF